MRYAGGESHTSDRAVGGAGRAGPEPINHTKHPLKRWDPKPSPPATSSPSCSPGAASSGGDAPADRRQYPQLA